MKILCSIYCSNDCTEARAMLLDIPPETAADMLRMQRIFTAMRDQSLRVERAKLVLPSPVQCVILSGGDDLDEAFDEADTEEFVPLTGADLNAIETAKNIECAEWGELSVDAEGFHFTNYDEHDHADYWESREITTAMMQAIAEGRCPVAARTAEIERLHAELMNPTAPCNTTS